MSHIIPFSKYHGLGNDFLLVRQKDLPNDICLSDLIQKSCDRHTGIGADGFIILKENPLEMIYYNQDASRAAMCGNGIRCFAAFARDEGLPLENPFSVKTKAGTKTVSILSQNPFIVRVNMGKPDYDPVMIGVEQPEPVWNQKLESTAGEFTIYSFFMSTIHTVLFCKDAFEKQEEAARAICFHPFFQEQTNVNFVEVVDESHLKVQTFERGCGWTLACGTGVCASVVTAHRLGLCKNKVEVELLKGKLTIEITEDGNVLMSGPARRIMKGDYDYD